MSKTKGAYTYTDRQLLNRLTKHCIELHLSKFTVSRPTWNCYKKRMAENELFENKVQDIMATAEQWWELQGINALNDKDYNTGMYAKLTSNKAFMRDHKEIEFEERLEALEEVQNEFRR